MREQSNTIGDLCVAIVAVCVVLFSVTMPHAATTISSTTSVNGKTVKLLAVANGDARTASLPCADASSRQCESKCTKDICEIKAGWTDTSGQSSSAGTFTFAAGQAPSPTAPAHQWCLSLLNSMGAPIGTDGSKKSTARTSKKNGQASINGYSCTAAIEPGVFAP